MLKCPFCETAFQRQKERISHQWQAHREHMLEYAHAGGPAAKAVAKVTKGRAKAPEASGKGAEAPDEASTKVSKTTPKATESGLKQASSVAGANFLTIKPTTYTISSLLLQVAQKATEVEWKWPQMEMQDWIDTYLFYSFKQRGIILGAYQTIPKDGDGGE